VFYRPNCWQLPNTALNIYYSSRLFSSIKSQSRYKRSQPHASTHPNMYFSCPKCTLRPLRTDVVNCYTPYFQSQPTTRKRKTLLWLTEIEHISFAPVMSTTLELTHRDNSCRHKEARQTNRPTLTLFHFANTTDYSVTRMETPWKRRITAPQATVTFIDSSLW